MQLLQATSSANTVAHTPDSANLSITDNLDVRARVIVDQLATGAVQTLLSKRQGGDEWQWRITATGFLELVWWDTGGVASVETSTVALPASAEGTTIWLRSRRAGTSVFHWTSTTDTNDHAAVSWTALGATLTTPSGSIRSTVATHINIGSLGNGGGETLVGYIYTAVILNDTTVRADPKFYDSTEWQVGDTGVGPGGDTGSDGVNTWTLDDGGTIVGDNLGKLPGLLVSVFVGFGTNIFSGQINWFDITEDVRTIHTERGKQYELDRIDQGIATLELENFDGKYNAHNTQSPYYPHVKPMVPIKVRAVYGGVIYPIWSGFVERWPVSTTDMDSLVSVQCADLFKPLAMAQVALEDRMAVVAGLSPVAVWRFTGSGVDDESVAGTHDLTLNGSPTTGLPGVWNVDEAVGFDGVDDYATVANEADVELLSDMTFEMWFKPQRTAAQTVETFNSDDTWVAPTNVFAVTAECWAGGGGGEAGFADQDSGAGGGGGSYAKGTTNVTPGLSYTIDVGAAGAGGVGEGGNGGNGGDSSFGGGLIEADGGKGGGTAGAGIGGAGGATSASAGRYRHAGGRGGDRAPGDVILAGGGGGGGSASATTAGQAGQAGSVDSGGAGGAGTGKGGNGGLNGSDGAAGAALGGGGGGGGVTTVIGGDGGAGAVGRVVLTYSEADIMVPFSVRGTDMIYQIRWDGYELQFEPATSPITNYSFGECTPDEWHHVVVSIDWSGATRIVKGYLDGVLVFDEVSPFQPAADVRSVAIGRRATGPSFWFKGEISEVVIYPTAITGEQAADLYNTRFEGFSTELTSERVEFVLTESSFLGAPVNVYDLETGVSLIDGATSPTGITALEAIQQATDTERGTFFIAADGTPTFRNRHYRILEQSTPIATIDQSDYDTIEAGVDDELIYNDVSVAASTLALPFRATDEESIGQFGIRPYDLTIYPANPNEAYDAAHYIVQQYGNDETRISALDFKIVAVSDLALILGVELGDRYNVEAPMSGDDLDLDCHVEKVTFDIDLDKRFYTRWELSAASESGQFWLMGVPGFSEVGVTTFFGYVLAAVMGSAGVVAAVVKGVASVV